MFVEDNYIMWLARIEGISIKKKEDMLEYFGSAEEIFKASNIQLENFAKKHRININGLLKIKDEDLLKDYINELYKKNIRYITKYNFEFPKLLKNITNCPLGLYVIGEIPDDLSKKVAVIGARKCTQYGSNNAYKFSKELAEKGVVIVSGMALGIDSMAHKGAIDGGGKTIAILGCGVDLIYPAINKTLRENIIYNGCVISEFAPGTNPYPTNFPIRNRIISGISEAILVIEAAKRSGTLITVGQALDQGRDVFALPGNINNIMSQGTNDLLKDAAFPLTDIKDVLFNLGINENKENVYNEEELLLPDEKIIYELIMSEPISIDEIIIKSNLQIQIVQYCVTMLELKGLVQKIAGQRYIRAL